MSTSPIRTTLIGHGDVGQTFHAPLIANVEGLSLDLIASGDEKRCTPVGPCRPAKP
jgi:hypothetical protein